MKLIAKFLLFIIFSIATVVNGAVVLNVDFTDPSAVVVTATGANSLVSDAGTGSNNGFQLYGALPNNTTALTDIGGSVASTLRPIGTGSAADTANQAYTDATQTGGVTALNLYFTGVFDLWTLTAGSPAFTGTVTVDLSNVAIGALPSVGDSGNVHLGYDPVSGVIGTWEAVPEPSTYAIAVGGLLFGVGVFRRIQKNRCLRQQAVSLPNTTDLHPIK